MVQHLRGSGGGFLNRYDHTTLGAVFPRLELGQEWEKALEITPEGQANAAWRDVMLGDSWYTQHPLRPTLIVDLG